MKLLIDAHALIWAVDDPSKLAPRASLVLRDPEDHLFLSAGTIWEIAIKVGLGKLTLALPFRRWIEQTIDDLGIAVLPITVAHADAQSVLPRHHGDPFDRLLVAQAGIEGCALVSSDPVLDEYPVSRIW